MDLLHAAILGIVEGITEFLPVSSTGHLILASRLLGLPESEFLKSFEIAIQLGAILSVVVLYWRRFLLDGKTLSRVLAAFIPTAVIGFLLHKLAKQYLLGNPLVVIAALFLGGIALIVFERFHRENEAGEDDPSVIGFGKAALIGVFQAVAIVPGVSRSAATILGGLSLGLKRKTIVEFSFLLAVPTMLAATVLDLLKSGGEFSSADWGALLVGGVVSFAVALASIRFLLGYVRKHSFTAFGVYRIAASIVFWFVLYR